MAMLKAKELVASNSVVVFSKAYCPYCVRVKELLAESGANFNAVELDNEKKSIKNARKSIKNASFA